MSSSQVLTEVIMVCMHMCIYLQAPPLNLFLPINYNRFFMSSAFILLSVDLIMPYRASSFDVPGHLIPFYPLCPSPCFLTNPFLHTAVKKIFRCLSDGQHGHILFSFIPWRNLKLRVFCGEISIFWLI